MVYRTIDKPDRNNTSKWLSEKGVIFKITCDIGSIFDSGSNKHYLSIEGVHALT